ncbi:GNAT family N-acetyltransferase [Comamonas serinivorans]|uniref:GNAT family N-acetyltransferase n=1 Tax=Comamonas serinivorans TaxID=1082851 RepID=UPI0012FC5D42|nr:GNAT family N-acetyltransferase [Comamonas serinivorans]
MNAVSAPRLLKAAQVRGRHVLLRNAEAGDAAFIWQLRHHPARNRYMSPTSSELDDQRAWLAAYARDETQAYFVITQADSGEALGTVRLYDARGDSFCWGSWMLLPGVPATTAMESALIVYRYAWTLGFRRAHFEVHRDNAPVRRFHERFGAQVVGEREDQVQYGLAADALRTALDRYTRWLPEGIHIVPHPFAGPAPADAGPPSG